MHHENDELLVVTANVVDLVFNLFIGALTWNIVFSFTKMHMSMCLHNSQTLKALKSQSQTARFFREPPQKSPTIKCSTECRFPGMYMISYPPCMEASQTISGANTFLEFNEVNSVAAYSGCISKGSPCAASSYYETYP